MRRRFPGVLDEVTLSQKIRLVKRNAEVDVRGTVGAAEVVDKVRKASKAAARSKRERTALVERRTLTRRLSQDFQAAAEGVFVPDFRQRVLQQEVFGAASLRQVGGDTDGGKSTTAGEADVWQ